MDKKSSDAPTMNEGKRSSPREWDERGRHDDSASEPRCSPPSQWSRRREDEERPPETLTLDDSRSVSSSHQYPSDSGYHSSGALSDGPHSTIYVDPGYHTASSMRSGGSVGSQEERLVGTTHSGGPYNAPLHRQFSWGGPPGRVMVSAAAHIMNGETRFPTAMSYAASEAAKSDIATVCSGSVVEDIDVASVLSADINVPQTPTSERIVSKGTANSAGSGGGGVRHSNSGGIATPRSVEFAPSMRSGLSATMPPRQQHPPLLATSHSSPTLRPIGPTIAIPVNDMGPPLSRSWLLQQNPPGGGGERPFGGSSSRAGSVRSFGSQRSIASSDVVAHVDTDDCGGSLAESVEGHSVHSGDDNDEGASHDDERKEGDSNKEFESTVSNPLLQNGMSSNHTNGRTSPGGTVYKGRGVRRYQGRYMKLPLKRFHQNGVMMVGDADIEEDGRMLEGERHNLNGYHYHDDPAYDRSSPRWGMENGRHGRSRSRSPPPPMDRRDNDHRKRSWSPPVTRSTNRSPRGRNNGRRKSRGRGSNGWTCHTRPRGRGNSGSASNRSTSPSKATNGRSPSRSYKHGNRRKSSNGGRSRGRP